MSDTPNTTGPSDALKVYHLWADVGRHHVPILLEEENDDGEWIKKADALAALSRAREGARREALEEAVANLSAYGDRLRSRGLPSHLDAADTVYECVDRVRDIERIRALARKEAERE